MRWELLTGAVTYLLQTPAITFPQEVGEQVAALASELRVAVLPCISKRVIGGLAGGWRGGCARLLPALGETGCAMGRRRARVSRAPTQNPRPDAALGWVNGGSRRRWLRRRRRWLATWRCGRCGGGRFPLWRRGRPRPAREAGAAAPTLPLALTGTRSAG